MILVAGTPSAQLPNYHCFCKPFLWRNHAVDRSTVPWLLDGKVVCSLRSLFHSAANCTWLPLRISKVPVFLCHSVIIIFRLGVELFFFYSLTSPNASFNTPHLNVTLSSNFPSGDSLQHPSVSRSNPVGESRLLHRHFRDVTARPHGNNVVADDSCARRHIGATIVQSIQ